MEKIIYFARKLKSFTFDDIFMLAETSKPDLQKALDELIKNGQLKKLPTGYVYLEQPIALKENTQTAKPQKHYNYGIFVPQNTKCKNLTICEIINKFLEEYVAKFCTFNTVRSYKSLFKVNILPYFKDAKIEDIDMDDVKDFFFYCQDKNISAKRLKNTLALLNQLLHYAKDNGFTDKICNFQVRRLNSKNEFNLGRVTFQKGAC